MVGLDTSCVKSRIELERVIKAMRKVISCLEARRLVDEAKYLRACVIYAENSKGREVHPNVVLCVLREMMILPLEVRIDEIVGPIFPDNPT